ETLDTAQKEYWKNAVADIRKGNEASLKASSDRSAEMEKQFKVNQDLRDAMEEVKKQKEDEIAELQRKLKRAFELVKGPADKGDAAAIANMPRLPGEQPHALILDISQGKPLWD